MQIISQFAPLPLAQPEKGTAVAMGYFDGIHIGHRAVMQKEEQVLFPFTYQLMASISATGR